MRDESFVLIPENLAIKKPDKKLLEIINSKKFDDKVLFETESSFHKIAVVENEIGRFLHYKNTYQAGFIDTEFYKGNLPYINYFLIPYLMNPKIQKILLIGMGTGKIVKDFESLFENLKRIDVVDLEENIMDIAENYFGFKQSDKFNFILQDGIAFLRNNKAKYDLIVVDVANNDGIDLRFLEDEYFEYVSKSLKKDGIFVSNLCSSAEFENPKNSFLPSILKKYKQFFKNVQVYKGDYSDKVYYKCFFNLDERVIDITNVILISSNKYNRKNIDLNPDKSFTIKFEKLGIEIQNYLDDFFCT